jgi:hypothetical protein
MKHRDLRPGETFIINGEEFKLVKYCDEPKDGLAVVESRGWGFTIPIVILQAAWKTLEQREPFAVWEPWRLVRDPDEGLN